MFTDQPSRVLSDPQLKTLNFICSLLGKRILPCYFYQKNPRGMMRWQFNLCRQTSILLNLVIREMLLQWQLDDQYTVESWDGDFSELHVLGHLHQYNHAWVFVRHTTDSDHDVLIDKARVEQDIPLTLGRGNHPADLLSHPVDGGQTREIQREKMDIDALLGSSEYYTQKNTREIYLEVRAMLALYSPEFMKPLPPGVLYPAPALVGLPETVYTK